MTPEGSKTFRDQSLNCLRAPHVAHCISQVESWRVLVCEQTGRTPSEQNSLIARACSCGALARHVQSAMRKAIRPSSAWSAPGCATSTL